jgi:hypothetical protein
VTRNIVTYCQCLREFRHPLPHKAKTKKRFHNFFPRFRAGQPSPAASLAPAARHRAQEIVGLALHLLHARIPRTRKCAKPNRQTYLAQAHFEAERERLQGVENYTVVVLVSLVGGVVYTESQPYHRGFRGRRRDSLRARRRGRRLSFARPHILDLRRACERRE